MVTMKIITMAQLMSVAVYLVELTSHLSQKTNHYPIDHKQSKHDQTRSRLIKSKEIMNKLRKVKQ